MSFRQLSAQYVNLVSTSPHSSPWNDPSGSCREAMKFAVSSRRNLDISSHSAKICTAESVYRTCLSWPSLAPNPPSGCSHRRTHAMMSSRSSISSRRPIRSIAVRPQYTPLMRRCSVSTYSIVSRSEALRLTKLAWRATSREDADIADKTRAPEEDAGSGGGGDPGSDIAGRGASRRLMNERKKCRADVKW